MQEGIDVNTVELVVCFNADVLTAGVDLVQLSGRARAKEGRFVVLTSGAADRITVAAAQRQAKNMAAAVALMSSSPRSSA